MDRRKEWENIKITEIEWDASENGKVWAGLPNEISVSDMDIDLSKYDPNDNLDYNDDFLYEVSEWLSARYGFCHDGFMIVKK